MKQIKNISDYEIFFYLINKLMIKKFLFINSI